MYYYVKNLQGDIVKIVKQDGTVAAIYTYDAWWKILSIKDTANNEVPSSNTFHVANLNPYRYRGYIYDNETGLYYLQSRYYDPVTGRFINADIYCDTMSSIFGTNMFAYCNNNPVNRIDPDGNDAIWLQFGEAVKIFGFLPLGHTSLLIQDDQNNWWYFYRGLKHVILRPCGKDDFTMAELNSYLSGFDPRPHHNYYVYATNVINDSEDANYFAGPDYYLKCHDGAIDGSIRFYGDFNDSYKYAIELIGNLYYNSNATDLFKYTYENGKKFFFYDVCADIYVNENVNQIVPDAISPVNHHYVDIIGNGNCKSYNFRKSNCVQVSMDILLKGSFCNSSLSYKETLEDIYYHDFFSLWPKHDYDRLT